MRKNGIASAMISSQVIELSKMEIKRYTKDRISDVLQFERDLRAEENLWGWEIDEKYIANVTASFEDPAFANSLSCLPIWMEKSWAESILPRYAAASTALLRHIWTGSVSLKAIGIKALHRCC